MATNTCHFTAPMAGDSLPLLTIGDEKPDKGVQLGRATKSSKALREATADHQDIRDSDDEALENENKLEVQADTSESNDHAPEGDKEVTVQAGRRDTPRHHPRPRQLRPPRPQPQPRPRLKSPAIAATDVAPADN